MGFTKQNINKSIIHSMIWQSLAIEYIELYFLAEGNILNGVFIAYF
jgi:hypothetical protein